MEREKSKNQYVYFKKNEIISILILLCATSLILGFMVHDKVFRKKDELDIPEEIGLFIENYKYILDNYYEDIDKNKVINGAIEGMIESLGDRYTTYLNEEENALFKTELDGYFYGIGVVISNTQQGKILVTSVFEDSPASKADIRGLDQLIKVDDLELENLTTKEFTNYVKNSNKNEFTIVLRRNNEEITKKIKKEKIIIPSVHYKVLDNNIGYIDVDLFASNTDQQFVEKLTALENEGITSLIVDLRNNTGGHLNVVENMLSELLDKKHIIYQTQVKEETTKVYSKGTRTKTYPIVILANENSASASEVMIGALRDEYGAKIVGMTTFGKGTIQKVMDFNENSAYKFTTKKWLTPNGEWVNEKGIKPDFEVTQVNYIEFVEEKDDLQLQKAIEVLKSW